MEGNTQGKGKKVVVIFLVIALLAGAIGGIFWYLNRNKDNTFTDDDAKKSVIQATRVMDEIARSALNTTSSIQSGATTAPGVQSNVIAASENDVNKYDFEDFYFATFAYPGTFVSLADYLIKEGTYKLGTLAYTNITSSYNEGGWYIKIENKNEIVKVSIKCVADDFTVDCIYFIDYDVKNNKLNDYKMTFRTINADESDPTTYFMEHLDVENNKVHMIMNLGLKDKTYNEFIKDAADNKIDNDYVETYFTGSQVEVMFAEVNFDNNKLSRYEGYSADGWSNDDGMIDYSDLTDNVKSNLVLELAHLGDVMPTDEAEFTSSINVADAQRTFVIEDAINYAENKYSYETAVDENGNEYYISNLKTLDEYKAEIDAVYDVVSLDRPFYENIQFESNTKSVKNARLAGLVGSIKEYLYAKNENNFAGLSYITYGNYQFTIQVATEDADTEPLLTHVYNTMGYTASNKDEIAVSRVYAKYEIQGNTTYMELTYILNRDGEVQFITFKALPEPNTYYDSTYHYMSCYQYVNVGTAKGVQHLTSTSYVYDTNYDQLTKFYQYNCTFYDNGFGQGHSYCEMVYANGVETQIGEQITNAGVSTPREYTHEYDEVLMENSPINGVCNFNDYFYESVRNKFD